MKKLNNKKGFTLAELLIVVAIIAVLTAIAVPLFVGALNNAEDSVKDANIRAVRVEASARILLAETPTETADEAGIFTGSKEAGFKRREKYKVTAKVSASGAITELTFADGATGGTDSCEKDTDAATDKNKKYVVTVYLTLSDLSTNA